MEAIISKSLDETEVVATKLLRKLMAYKSEEKAGVVLLSGDLGSGKTAFVKLLGRRLGIKDEITSPTFLIMKKYETKNPFYLSLVHIDAYRVEDPKEFETLRLGEIFSDPNILVVIEWPEKMGNVIPRDAYTLSFEFIDETTRKISVPEEMSL